MNICSSIAKCFILSVIVLGIAGPQNVKAQRVEGKWYGVGAIDIEQATNSYLCELLLAQEGNIVTGEFNYYFRNGYFSNKVKGTFTLDSRFMYISLIPVMYNRTVNTLVGVDCPMHGEFVLKISRTESTLSGQFISDALHQYTCAPLKVNFRKMAKDDPTLKERVNHVNKDDTIEVQPAAPIAVAPVVKDTIKSQPVKPAPPQPAAPVVTTQQQIAKNAEAKVALRAVSLERVLDVSDDSVRIDLYDNGILDYDTATVFFNKKMVEYQRLLDTRKPISFYVHVDVDEANNDLIMYADNLGRIPPNSALMVVTDKSHRYEVSLSSDFQKSASVRLRKTQKPVSQ